MPDLSSLPPDLIGPFALVFALALFVSKIFDIFEKWRSFNTTRNYESVSEQVNGEDIVSAVDIGESNCSSSANESLSAKTIFLYSFIGAISIEVLSIIIGYIFIDNVEYLEARLSYMVDVAFFGFVSAIICAFFIKNKFPLIAQSHVVAVLMGFGVSALLSMPVGLILNISRIN